MADMEWGERVRKARLGSGVDIDTAASEVALDRVAFREYLERVEASQEAPDGRLERSRARLVLLGFGLDLAAFALVDGARWSVH